MTKTRLAEIPGYIHTGEIIKLDPMDYRLRRAIVEHWPFYEDCALDACRRSGRCRGRTVPCFDTNRALIVEYLTEFMLEGYQRDPEYE